MNSQPQVSACFLQQFKWLKLNDDGDGGETGDNKGDSSEEKPLVLHQWILLLLLRSETFGAISSVLQARVVTFLYPVIYPFRVTWEEWIFPLGQQLSELYYYFWCVTLSVSISILPDYNGLYLFGDKQLNTKASQAENRSRQVLICGFREVLFHPW